MCIDIIKSPVSAFAAAKKKQAINKTLNTLAESSVLFALSAVLLGARASALSVGVAGIAAFIFLLSFLAAMLIGWVIDIVATILGGKGSYFDGLTTVSYSSLFLSGGIFVASILSFLPVAGLVLGIIAMLPAFAAAFACFYRGVREMYKTDMITAFVTVSITSLTLITVIQLFVFFGMANFFQMMPMMNAVF